MQWIKRTTALLLAISLFFCVSTTALAADQVTGVPFTVPNMFPGDSVAEEYTVTVRHRDPLTLYFGIDIPNVDNKLAEALHVKVVLPSRNLTLYDGLMKDIPADGVSVVLPRGENKMVYAITVTLPTSADNEYRNLDLTVDLLWWYVQESSGGGGYWPWPSPGPPPQVKPDGVDTGDSFSAPLYIGLGAVALCGVALLVLSKRKGGRHEQ